jgi:putative FmdB family regulatory protein
MPVYDFICQDCRQPFDKLVRSSAQLTEVRCPTCGSPTVKKQMSSFATKAGGGQYTSAVNCATGST